MICYNYGIGFARIRQLRKIVES